MARSDLQSMTDRSDIFTCTVRPHTRSPGCATGRQVFKAFFQQIGMLDEHVRYFAISTVRLKAARTRHHSLPLRLQGCCPNGYAQHDHAQKVFVWYRVLKKNIITIYKSYIYIQIWTKKTIICRNVQKQTKTYDNQVHSKACSTAKQTQYKWFQCQMRLWMVGCQNLFENKL
jgi:hypothetical protein